jgi:hypothetical protein
VGDSKEYSGPVTLSLSDYFFSALGVTSATETTLSANQPVAALKASLSSASLGRVQSDDESNLVDESVFDDRSGILALLFAVPHVARLILLSPCFLPLSLSLSLA